MHTRRSSTERLKGIFARIFVKTCKDPFKLVKYMEIYGHP